MQMLEGDAVESVMRRKTGPPLFCPSSYVMLIRSQPLQRPQILPLQDRDEDSLLLLPRVGSSALAQVEGPTAVPIAVDYLK